MSTLPPSIQRVASPLPRISSSLPPLTQDDDRLFHPHSLSPPPEKQRSMSDAIPWKALLPILVFRISDACAYMQMFPWVTAAVSAPSWGVRADRIGLVSGTAEGIMMIVEAVVAPAWANIADKHGRRPAMLWGFSVCLAAAGVLGFSTSPYQLILWRALFGLNPIGVIGKIQASEICNRENRAKVFAIFSPGFALGSMLGTTIGGELSEPYGRLPAWMGGATELWRTYPFALPCVVVTAIGAVGTIIGYFGLPETKPVHEEEKGSEGSTEKRRPKSSYMGVLRVPQFMMITTIFCCFQLSTMSFDGIQSVWLYTAVDQGGLGLAIDTIGHIMASNSLMYILLAPLTLPKLQKRIGAVRCLRIACWVYPVLSFLMPCVTYFARTSRPLMWVGVLMYMSFKCLSAFAWPLCDQLTTGVFDDYPHLLATGSAVSLIAGAFGRAIGPGIAGWLYSISTTYEQGTMGRNIPWMLIFFSALPTVVLSYFLGADVGERRTGYEAVPMLDAERGSEEAIRVSGVELHVPTSEP